MTSDFIAEKFLETARKMAKEVSTTVCMCECFSSTLYTIQSTSRIFMRFIITRNMPVKLFREELTFGKKEEYLLALEDQINAFEKEIEEHGMRIRDIALSV